MSIGDEIAGGDGLGGDEDGEVPAMATLADREGSGRFNT